MHATADAGSSRDRSTSNEKVARRERYTAKSNSIITKRTRLLIADGRNIDTSVATLHIPRPTPVDRRQTTNANQFESTESERCDAIRYSATGTYRGRFLYHCTGNVERQQHGRFASAKPQIDNTQYQFGRQSSDGAKGFIGSGQEAFGQRRKSLVESPLN